MKNYLAGFGIIILNLAVLNPTFALENNLQLSTPKLTMQNAKSCFKALNLGVSDYTMSIPYGMAFPKDGGLQLIQDKIQFCEVQPEWAKNGVIRYKVPGNDKLFYYRLSNHGHDGWSGDRMVSKADFDAAPQATCSDISLDQISIWLKSEFIGSIISYHEHLATGGRDQEYKGAIICNIETECRGITNISPEPKICSTYPANTAVDYGKLPPRED